MPDLEWQRSSFSNGSGSGECVEVATAAETFYLRESDDPEVVLIARPARLSALLGAIKADRYDL
jgi:hypothetical protein